MVNRAIFGVIDPNFWVGWVILIAALVVAILVSFVLERAHLVRVSIRTGVIYGAALWLVAGVVIMPLIGTIAPPTPPLSGVQPPDPMQATVMMYSLGPLASVAALIAWLLFGAALGATGRTPERRDTFPGGSGTRIWRFLGVAILAGFALAVMSSPTVQVHATNSTLSPVTVQTLAQGPLKNLPPGKVCFNILEFRQLPGAAYGPHDHPPLVVYTLHGTVTISYPEAAARSVGPGDAAFIPALVPAITQDNVEGRVGAAAIAVGLIAVVILLCAATRLRGGRRSVITSGLSLLLIAGGALVLTGATSNDYYFIAARPGCAHPAAMPVPFGRVTFWSSDLNPVPAGPYVETLSAITVSPGARYDALKVPRPEMVIVVKGTAAVDVGDGTRQLSGGGAAFAQAGEALAVVNPGGDNLEVLSFAVTPRPPI